MGSQRIRHDWATELNQWISTIWTWNCISAPLVAMISASQKFPYIQMIWESLSHADLGGGGLRFCISTELPKDSDAAGPWNPPGGVKVYNHLHYPLAFLMPWCSFSFEFKERKKSMWKNHKTCHEDNPQSYHSLCMEICYQNTHWPSWYQYKQGTLNFATAHNQ